MYCKMANTSMKILKITRTNHFQKFVSTIVAKKLAID